MEHITPEKNIAATETTLLESEQFRSHIFETSPIPVVTMDAKTLRYIDCNPAAVNVGGYASKEEMLCMTPTAHVDLPQYDGTPSGEKGRYYIEQAKKLGRVEFEWRHQRPNGELWDAHVHLMCFRSGDRDLMQFTLQDITARKRAEAELQRYFDCSLDLLCIADTTGRFLRLNPEWEQRLGYPICELEGRIFLELVHPDDLAPTLDVIARLERQEEIMCFENRYRCKDGSYRWIEWRSRPVGKIIYAAARDITARKQSEEDIARLNVELEDRVQQRTTELAEANQQLRETLSTLQHAQKHLVRNEKLVSLGALVAGVAHELNTPLGNSYTLSTTLQEIGRDFLATFEKGELKRSTLKHYVDLVNEAADRISRNLYRANEMIAHFKQVTADQTSAQRRRFELKQNIEEVVSILQPQFKRTTHQIILGIEPDLMLESYPGPLDQIITNLVINAQFHGFDGRENGIIHIHAEALDRQRVRISISDNGCGIPPENMPRIFDPFFTTRLGSGGSGLGLHIVYSIATRVLGGSIDVSSNSEGTVFTLDIPLIAPMLDKKDAEI
ncbi:MAG: multi-sensor signal transduction histidine kinase [Proteobacteria bacterium]|nr:multi-sensor signal transduction histidine kinase [Pseudomonadota bacterium]